MSASVFARIQDGHVVELFTTSHEIVTLFNPDLVWIDVTSIHGVAEGWSYDGAHFLPPSPIGAPPSVSLAALEAQVQALASQIAALSKS